MGRGFENKTKIERQKIRKKRQRIIRRTVQFLWNMWTPPVYPFALYNSIEMYSEKYFDSDVWCRLCCAVYEWLYECAYDLLTPPLILCWGIDMVIDDGYDIIGENEWKSLEMCVVVRLLILLMANSIWVGFSHSRSPLPLKLAQLILLDHTLSTNSKQMDDYLLSLMRDFPSTIFDGLIVWLSVCVCVCVHLLLNHYRRVRHSVSVDVYACSIFIHFENGASRIGK